MDISYIKEKMLKKIFLYYCQKNCSLGLLFYYCRKNKENFIHSCIWTALSITLMILDSSLFSASEANLFCHLPVVVSWGSSVKAHVFGGIFLQFVVSESKFQPKIQKYKLSQFFLNLAIKNNSDFLNMGSMNRYFVTLNMQT